MMVSEPSPPGPAAIHLYWAGPIDWSISQRGDATERNACGQPPYSSTRTATRRATSPRPSASCVPPRPTAPSWSRCRRSGTCWPPARSCWPAPSRSTAPASTAARGWARGARHPPAGRQHLRARRRREGLQHLGPDRPRRRRTSPSTARSTCSTSTSAASPTASPSTSSPATEIVTAPVGELSVGLSVCYDLRFPELFRILAVRGARLLAVPSAFTAATGRDHWEVLLRARAIENQAFVLAPNQVGEAPPHFDSYGHSAIVDPWGDGPRRSPPTRSASSPPTSTSPSRSGSASRCPRSPTAGPRPTSGRSSTEARA